MVPDAIDIHLQIDFEAGRGQVVVQTSATGEKPSADAMAYSTMRAAANMMVRCAALTAAPKNE